MSEIIEKDTESVEQRKGFHIFYLLPIVYVICMYLLPEILLSTTSEQTDGISIVFYVIIILGICNIVVTAIFTKPKNRLMMLNAMVLVKYAMIPFFIIGGFVILCTFLSSFIPVPFMIFLGPFLTAGEAVIGWLILVFEAPYTIAYLRLSVKAGRRSKVMAVLHGILQFFFTVDVIDVMILTWKERRWRKLTIAIIVILSLAILAVLILILLFALGLIGGVVKEGMVKP